MNKQQKDYTIKEIDSYNKQIDSLYYRINRNAMFTFCGVGLAVATFVMNNGEVPTNEVLDNFIGVAASGAAVYNGVKAVQRICERASLQHTVRMLEHEKAMSELETPKKMVKRK